MTNLISPLILTLHVATFVKSCHRLICRSCLYLHEESSCMRTFRAWLCIILVTIDY